MSGINSSNYYSATTGTSGNGMAGLVSGMDTAALVEKMLSGTQNKINKQEGLKQQDLWRQEIYREMISSINSFYGKFFDSRFGASTTNNFASTSFFDSMVSAVTKGSALKILGSSSSASVGEMRVKVKELASSSSITSGGPVSKRETIDGAVLNPQNLQKDFAKQVTFTYGTNSSITMDFSQAKSADDVAATINRGFTNAGIDAKATMEGGRLSINTGSTGVDLKVDIENSTSLGLKLTGLSKNTESVVKDEDGNEIANRIRAESGVDTNAGYEFTITLDGVSKLINIRDVKVDSNGKITEQAVKDALASEVKRAFGEYVTVDLKGDASTGYKIQLGLNFNDEPGHELKVTGSNALKLGLTPGASTRISMSSKLSSLGMGGDKFSFSINGKEFSFTGNDTLGTVVSKINSSEAGVRISYSALSDTFKMEATSTGAKYGISIEQTEGNLMGTLFGNDKVSASGALSSTVLTNGKITGNPGGLDADYSTAGAALTMKVNGSNYTFVLPKKSGTEVYDKDEIETEFNSWLKKTFGTEDGSETGPASISYENGELKIADRYHVSFDKTNIDLTDDEVVKKAVKTDLALAFGFNKEAKTNVANNDTPVSEVALLAGLDVRDANGNAAATLGDIKKINGHDVTYVDGRLKLTGSGEVDFTGTNLAKLFGGDKFTLSDGAQQADAVKQGTDALVEVNGVETRRSSNSFTIDGVSMELTSKSPEIKDANGGVIDYEETVIGTSRDTDTVVEGFKSFIEDYNSMIEKLNGYISEEPKYKSYAPLTIEQRKEMGDREIELWEENAKKGLVRRDSNVEQFLSEMRLALYSKPAGSKFALYNIGIDTSSNMKDKGKLVLDETALRNALASDPDAVKELFTNATEGISKKLMSAMDRAAKESSGSPGSLVQLAGTKDVLTKKNTIYDRIAGIESRIKDLKYKYERERQRYWNQFSSMESILSNMNQQMMQFQNQMGG